jgi:hypothetical protein
MSGSVSARYRLGVNGGIFLCSAGFYTYNITSTGRTDLRAAGQGCVRFKILIAEGGRDGF